MAEAVFRAGSRKVTITARRRPTRLHKLWNIDPNDPKAATYNRSIDETDRELQELDRQICRFPPFGGPIFRGV